jgi:CPA2 family monovalent cation:H+ antiporter-2/glutathione-regulated potassium-efflux system protein KefB
MLADSPYRHELEADVEPFRSILLGLFFLAVGMMLDLSAIAERPLFVLAMAAALIVAKAGIIGGIALAFRMKWRQALALGLLLSQGGEFGFVLFAQAQDAYLIAPEAASLFGAIVTLSMATTPFLMMLTSGIRAEPIVREERAGPVADGSNAIIVGYGRFGQTVGQMLLTQGIAVTLVDTDIEMIDIAGDFGSKVYYGDGTRLDLLRQAGAADAELILFCMDRDQITPDLIEAVHEAFPNASIFVRAFDRRALLRLKGTPVAGVVREVLDSAVHMARDAMASLGIGGEEIDRTEDLYRQRDRERLRIQHEAGDIRAARDQVIAQTGGWGPDDLRREDAAPLSPGRASDCG